MTDLQLYLGATQKRIDTEGGSGLGARKLILQEWYTRRHSSLSHTQVVVRQRTGGWGGIWIVEEEHVPQSTVDCWIWIRRPRVRRLNR